MLFAAVREALDARPGFSPDWIVLGMTGGGMELGEQFFHAAAGGAGGPGGPAYGRAARRVRGYLPQVPVNDVAHALGIRAPVRIVSNACASGADAIGLGWQLVSSGAARRVLAGGCDGLSRFVYGGFDCLQALTPGVCRPFDRARDGLTLGEGAAVLLLENEGAVRVAGYGAASDTHHLTQPHPDGRGPLAAMRRALAAAATDVSEVGHVNAHGTATVQNDACEAAALRALGVTAPVTSTKALTGHALGAAGAIEAVFSCLSILHGFVPATLNYTEPDEGVRLDIVSGGARAVSQRVVVSNSFGFGGANASLVFQRA